MSSLESIKNSLENNSNLTDEIRSKLFDLVTIFHEKLPEADLSRLANKISDVKFSMLPKLERKGIYYYDALNNEILLSNLIKGNFDIDNILVQAILEMSTSTGKFTGFNSDERLNTLNLAYTEKLATFVIGNDYDTLLESELLVADLLSHIVGIDTMNNSYFSNNGTAIIKAMNAAEIGLNSINSNDRLTDEILKRYNYSHDAHLSGVEDSNSLSKLLQLLGKLFSGKIQTDKLGEDEVNAFEMKLPKGDYVGVNQKGLSVATDVVVEQNAASLVSVEAFNIPVERSKTLGM